MNESLLGRSPVVPAVKKGGGEFFVWRGGVSFFGKWELSSVKPHGLRSCPVKMGKLKRKGSPLERGLWSGKGQKKKCGETCKGLSFKPATKKPKGNAGHVPGTSRKKVMRQELLVSGQNQQRGNLEKSIDGLRLRCENFSVRCFETYKQKKRGLQTGRANRHTDTASADQEA